MSDELAQPPATAPGFATDVLYYFTQQGVTAGPVPMAALADLTLAGRLGRDDLVWADGDAASNAAADVPALAHLFAQQPLSYQTPPRPTLPFATFWQRFVAYVVDAVLVAIANAIMGGVMGALIGVAMAGSGGGRNGTLLVANGFSSLFGIAVAWMYHALMESSANRATLGKMAMGLIVVDDQGRRLTFGRATGRYFAKFISSLTLGIGFLMVLWTERRQALHDIIATTLVLKK